MLKEGVDKDIMIMNDDEFAYYLHENGGCIGADTFGPFSRSIQETKDSVVYWLSNFPGNEIGKLIDSIRNGERMRRLKDSLDYFKGM